MKTKINISMIIITSIACILPVFYGLLVYNNLPAKIGIPIFGFDSEGNYNWHFHKAYPAFGMPLLILALNIIYKNPRYSDESKAMRIIMDWICPVMALIAVPLWLFRAMGADIPIEMILYIWIGFLFIICGNYIPKSKMDKSSMLGIKVPWGSNISDENWIKGRRNIGNFWIIGGIVYIVAGFLLSKDFTTRLTITLITLFILVIVPIIYSYLIYMKEKA